MACNPVKFGQNYYTVLWCHTLRPAPSHETMYGLVSYGLITE